MTKHGRSGRRPGNQDTRQAILHAAQTTFAELGFTGASMRKIAAAAGVDAALVHHYFGSKEQLFLASIEIPVDLPAVLVTLTADGIDGLGVRMAGTLVQVWDSPVGTILQAAFRSAIADPHRTRMIREFVQHRMIEPMLHPVPMPPEERDLRTGLLMSQLIGVAIGRYLVQIEPLASLPDHELIANVGATLQRYLDEPLVELAGIQPGDDPSHLAKRCGRTPSAFSRSKSGST